MSYLKYKMDAMQIQLSNLKFTVLHYFPQGFEESDHVLIFEVPGLQPGWFLSWYLAGYDLQMGFHPLLPPRIADTAFQLLSASKPQDMVVHIHPGNSHMLGIPNHYRSCTYFQPGIPLFSF